MRLIERRNVDLPQPDGPMSAVTLRGAAVDGDARTAPASRRTRTRIARPPPSRARPTRVRPAATARSTVAVIRTVPVTYASVRGSRRRREHARSSARTRPARPLSMNAVRSEMRAACCMLCVTMMIVTCDAQLVDELFDPLRADRIERCRRLVEQEHASATSRARARCTAAAAVRRRAPIGARVEAIASPRPTARRGAARCSTMSSVSRRDGRSRRGRILSPAATLSRIDIVGNGVGRWNTIPMCRRTPIALTLGA